MVVNQRSPTDDNWTPPPPYPDKVVIASLTAPQPLDPLPGAVSFSSGLRSTAALLGTFPNKSNQVGWPHKTDPYAAGARAARDAIAKRFLSVRR